MATRPCATGWQRNALLAVLALVGLGALAGGSWLLALPDGPYMNLPLATMADAFRDFLVPGVILCGLGLLDVGAFAAVLRRTPWPGGPRR